MDTLFMVKKLKQAGISEQQAEAHVQIISEAFHKANEHANAATKDDISSLRSEFRNDLLQVKVDLIKWVVGIAIAQIAITVTLIQLA